MLFLLSGWVRYVSCGWRRNENEFDGSISNDEFVSVGNWEKVMKIEENDRRPTMK